MEQARGDDPEAASDGGMNVVGAAEAGAESASVTRVVNADAVASAGALDAHRPMLLGLAYRLLGSRHDAEDVLQEAYLRWFGANRAAVAEPRRYLSRVVTRLAMDRLRARQAARETYVGPWLPEPVPTDPPPFSPLDRAEQRDSLAIALLHVLERLTPPQRAVYVLHAAFELPYAEIGEILDRSAADCRQLQHRAEARIRQDRRRFTAGPAEQERLLDAFLAAARDGDLAALTGLVAQDAIAWTDGGGRVRAARNPIVGADRVARFVAGVYGPRRPVTVRRMEFNGQPGALIGKPVGTFYALTLAAAAGRITGLYLVGNPEKLPVPPG
ncbi:RNA polymerase sigma factor SigJ [Micromonospora avicenniae]|uniref:RNA polymerase sigma factor SigJ n=1 Tax=Micromonospora avicenniae TaxID=1198245 RepID=UPI001FEB3232|nr:RNA polymerase sigma factor SigJ [Micromonospora avicenniae]